MSNKLFHAFPSRKLNVPASFPSKLPYFTSIPFFSFIYFPSSSTFQSILLSLSTEIHPLLFLPKMISLACQRKSLSLKCQTNTPLRLMRQGVISSSQGKTMMRLGLISVSWVLIIVHSFAARKRY